MENRINITRLCEIYQIEPDFVLSICEMDLLTVYSEGTERFISHDELPLIEKMLRLHHDLGINQEGLHTIHHLLERMQLMQEEIRSLRNRLGLYEDL